MSDLLAEAARLSRDGQPFVLATVVWRRAPTSGRPGDKALVLPDGTVHGWVGGACALPTLLGQAREALADGSPRLLALGPAAGAAAEPPAGLGAGPAGGAADTPGTPDVPGAGGVVRVPMACDSEGAAQIYLEPVLPAPRVVAVGGSELVDTLALLARDLGWRAVVVDDDPAPRTHPPGIPVTPLDGLDADEGTAVVVATQGHYDEPAVRAALATDAGYVGLVASRRRAAVLRAALARDGLPPAALERLRAPAGLDLGPVRHAGIAVCVLAELVALHAAGGLRVRPALTRPLEAVDPVCGMTVTVAGAHFVSEHGGRSVYFCAAGCQRAFEAEPDRYAPVPAPVSAPAAEG